MSRTETCVWCLGEGAVGGADCPWCDGTGVELVDEDENTCVDCDGTGWVLDETACGDPDHCSDSVWCGACNWEGQWDDR